MRVHVNEKKREDKRGYCAYENKKKTNYIFITIIGMITIIIAINYCQSIHHLLLLILFVDGLSPFPSPILYTLCYYYPIVIIIVTVITAIERLYYCMYMMR